MASCLDVNIEHTLFLGCSVEGFSLSLGWGDQSSDLTVNVIRDLCPGNKVYWDITSNSPKKTWTAADPGLFCYGNNQDESPRLGSPVYFRFGDFEYCGILQSWTKKDPATSHDRYEIRIASPTEILSGCEVITSDYSGPVRGFNIFNVYGFHEVFGGVASPVYTDSAIDGPIFGSLGGAFGGSLSNEAGIAVSKVLQGTAILTSSLIRSNLVGYGDFSEYGRIVYRGANTNARFGLLPRDDVLISLEGFYAGTSGLSYYLLDLSELPVTPDDYRINSTSINVLSLIGQVCNDFGCDYYIELIPVNISGTLYKIIKVRTVSRLLQPSTNVVQNFIESLDSDVISSNYGLELRKENNTAFIIGGKKRSIWQVYQGQPSVDPDEAWMDAIYGDNDYVRERIVSFYGTDAQGNILVPVYDDTVVNGEELGYYLNVDLTDLKTRLTQIGSLLPDSVRVYFSELKAAGAGFDTWQAVSFGAGGSTPITETYYAINNALNSILVGVYNGLRDIPDNVKTNMIGRGLARDFIKINPNVAEFKDTKAESADVKAIWEYYKKIYDNSTTKLLVRVPFAVAAITNDATLFTDVPAEGGWTEVPNVIGLANPGAVIDYFRNNDGTIGPFGVFSSGELNINEIADLDVYFDDATDTVYSKAEVSTDYLFLDKANLAGPRVLVEFNSLEKIAKGYGEENSLSLAAKIAGENAQRALIAAQKGADQNLDPNKQDAIDGDQEKTLSNRTILPPQIILPSGLAIPFQSNVITYGPWKPSNELQAGPPGGISVELNEEMVPWNYGSLSILETVAQAKADGYLTAMQVGEAGSITIPGIPTVPLGAEIASLQGLGSTFYNNNEHLVENRFVAYTSSTLTDFNGADSSFQVVTTPLGVWEGNFGPSVTNISVSLSESEASTTYTFRTFTPKFGFLSKFNADRIATAAKLNNAKAFQARIDNRLQQIKNANKKANSGRNSANRNNDDFRKRKGTPHSALVGQINLWDKVPESGGGDGSFRRTTVSSQSLIELNEIVGNSGDFGYANTAIMSLDGLIRPVSMDGDGGLPRFAWGGPDFSHDHPLCLPTAFFNGTDFWIDPSLSRPPHPLVYDFSATGPGGTFFNTGVGSFSEDEQSVDIFFGGYYTNIIGQNELNPFANPSGFNRTNRYNPSGSAGHDIDILARGDCSSLNYSGSSLIMPIDISGYEASGTRADYREDYRFLSLRGPLVIHGWGYDIDGKPIPNAADDEELAESGYFNYVELEDQFLPDFLRKSHTWPVAPVDLRFDRERNVWTVPPPRGNIRFKAIQNIGRDCYGSGLIVNYPWHMQDSTGNNIEYEDRTTVIHNDTNSCIASGSYGIAYYDNYSKVYRLINRYVQPLKFGLKENTSILENSISGDLLDFSYHYINLGKGLYISLTGFENTGASGEFCGCGDYYNTGTRPTLGIGIGAQDYSGSGCSVASITGTGTVSSGGIGPFNSISIGPGLLGKMLNDESTLLLGTHITYDNFPFTSICLDSGTILGQIDQNCCLNLSADIDSIIQEIANYTGEINITGSGFGVKVGVGACIDPADKTAPNEDEVFKRIKFSPAFILDDPEDGTNILVHAGIKAIDDVNTCIGDETSLSPVDPAERYSDITFKQGFILNRTAPCELEIGAGFRVETYIGNEIENSRASSEGDLFSKLRIGEGIAYEKGDEQCDLDIRGGVHFQDWVNRNTCIGDISSLVETDDVDVYSIIKPRKGIYVSQVDNRTVTLGAGFTAESDDEYTFTEGAVSDHPFNHIKFGAGLKVKTNDSESCTLEVMAVSSGTGSGIVSDYSGNICPDYNGTISNVTTTKLVFEKGLYPHNDGSIVSVGAGLTLEDVDVHISGDSGSFDEAVITNMKIGGGLIGAVTGCDLSIGVNLKTGITNTVISPMSAGTLGNGQVLPYNNFGVGTTHTVGSEETWYNWMNDEISSSTPVIGIDYGPYTLIISWGCSQVE